MSEPSDDEIAALTAHASPDPAVEPRRKRTPRKPAEPAPADASTTPGDIPSEEALATISRAELVPSATTGPWHVPPKTRPSKTPEGRPRLVLEAIHTLERVELSPSRDTGGFSQADVQLASYVLRDHRADEICPIDPRLLDLAYRVQRHFDAAAVRVVSGCRLARRRPSNHSRGRAVDMVVPGSSNADVAAFAHTLGFAGVGTYPNSDFIHLDTRPSSYFWVDSSGPGQPSKMRPVWAGLAAQADAAALARGETPPRKTPQEDDQNAESASDGETFNASTVRPRPLE